MLGLDTKKDSASQLQHGVYNEGSGLFARMLAWNQLLKG
jgi:hypothetical protein